MLKIKSNTNEFTIIFSEKIGKKINAEKFSIPALSFFLLQRLFLLLFSSGQCLSFASTLFFFSVLALPHFSPALTFFFSFGCPLFFSPKYFFFSPNVFQPKRFSAQMFFSFSAQMFFSFFSPNVFASVQPLFSSSFFCFILFWFSPLFSLSAPPFFLFFNFVYPRPNILSSCFKSLLFE